MKKDEDASFFSIGFHTRFFPALLIRRCRCNKERGTSFPSTMERWILFSFCILIVIIGIPNAMVHNSVIWWLVGGSGTAGVLALMTESICSQIKSPPTYDNFLFGVFFFFVFLGMTSGIFLGSLRHSFVIGLCASLAGIISGYVLGIVTGLYFQYLGWLALLVNLIAGLAIIGMIVLDLVLLLG